MTAETSGPEFDQRAYVTKGPWYIRHGIGAVTIEDGTLVLRGRKKDVIAERPISEVSARPRKGDAGAKVLIEVADAKYIVTWVPTTGANTGVLAAGVVGGAAAGMSARTFAKLPAQRRLTDEFLSVLQANGGRAGTT